MTNNATQIESSFLRLKQVLKRIPVSRSTWYRGMKSGIYPRPVKLGLRATGWKIEEINFCIIALGEQKIHDDAANGKEHLSLPRQSVLHDFSIKFLASMSEM